MRHTVLPETSRRMKAVRRTATKPEQAVRAVLRNLGLSYRCNTSNLPGTPDIVNRSARWAIFVHGCYWHGHEGCKLATVPKKNKRFWVNKFAANRARDRRKVRALRALGYRVITVWDCETRNATRLERRLRRALVDDPPVQMRGDDRAFLRSRVRHGGARGKAVRLVDLFSGCGGLTLGVAEAARALGRRVSIRLAVEHDEWISATYAMNFRPKYGDATDIAEHFDRSPGEELSFLERRTRKSVGKVDLLVGGPPCQGHSTLNNHTRGNDPKNELYLSVIRAAEVLRPRAIIIENVPAVVRDDAGTVDAAVKWLESFGYHVVAGTVSVADIGVPQIRKRHVLLAHERALPDLDQAIDAACVPPRSVRWAIGDLRNVESDDMRDTAPALSAENLERARYLLKHRAYDLPNRERPPCQQKTDHKYKSMYGRLRWSRPAQTITTGFGSPGQGRYLHPTKLRTITPHEAARLQFFPDWFDFSNLEHRAQVARAIGNAVPPKLGFVLAHHLLRLRAARRARPSTRPTSLGVRFAV